MKVFLISHIADADGVFPVVLTDLAFEDYDYELLDVADVDNFMKTSLDNHLFDDYDKVIMTDLCISNDMAEYIDTLDFKKKFQILDHHYHNEVLNKYSFVSVIDSLNGVKESGTSLYYKYLIKNYPNHNLLKESVSYMVTLVKLGDTWEWKKFNVEEARDISTILSFYGNDKFIFNYCNFLRNNREFYFTEAERVLINLDKKQIHDYIENKKEEVIIKEIENHKVGIVFAELYRSELGNALAEYYKDEVEFIIVININRSISYRSIKEDYSVADFASIFGGNGHQQAAGGPLPVDLKEKMIEYIFKKKEEM